MHNITHNYPKQEITNIQFRNECICTVHTVLSSPQQVATKCQIVNYLPPVHSVLTLRG